MRRIIKYRIIRRLLLEVCMLFMGGMLFSQSVSDVQLHKKIFEVSSESTLEVENKYGTILVVPWNKDSVQISVDVFLEAKNRSRLRKLQNDVHISFNGTKNYVIARTKIGEGNSRIVSELRALTNTLTSNAEVEINYTLYVPDYINLFLTNKFGDIYIDELHGQTDISLSNGVLKANKFNGKTTLELTFAEGRVNKMGTASINMSFAEIEIGSVNQLDLDSKSSEVHIDAMDIFKFDSKRDIITLNSVEYLYGYSSFTDIRVVELLREADCDMKYGKIWIEHVLPDFSRINLRSEYTSISMFVAPESSYDIDIMHNEKTSIVLPEANANISTKKVSSELENTSGYIGDAYNQRTIKITAEQKTYINISTLR